ncbi:MAG TPA: AI-2E family transporter [Burkholderiaceae bacterium]|nr:AI-2E family transporter [Burkholderiaceae bacterium]
MSLTSTQRQTLAWGTIGLVAFVLLWKLAPVLTPFIVGAVLAYVLRPAVERLVARRWPRAAAVLLVEVSAIIVVLAVMLLIVPILSKELPLLREQLPLLADRLNAGLSPWLAQFGVQVQLDASSIKSFIVKHFDANLDDWMSRALSSAVIGGSFVLSVVGNAVLVPLVMFYLLLDWPEATVHVKDLVPPRMRPGFDNFFAECDDVLGQYLRGQLLVMLILAVFYAVGLGMFRFELALPVGVFTGLAVFIPYVGYGLGLLLALLAAVLQFGDLYGLIAVAVVYGLGQLLEGFFLTPRLVGERIGLNPLMVIFALLAFGQLFGFIGVLIALPVSAVGLVAVRRLQRAYVASRLYQG